MNKPTTGIAVDGATSGNPGPSEYRGVDIETGKTLFHIKIGIATNNIAEYLGVCHGILYAIGKGLTTTVYSDSQTALSWIKSQSTKTTLPNTEKTKLALELMSRAKLAMTKHIIKNDGIDSVVDLNVTVSKWYTTEWGEIPADFENKKSWNSNYESYY
jgi:ribonuclease HI